jgi:RecB family exonuclease
VVRGEADWTAALSTPRLQREAERLRGPLSHLFAARAAFARARSFAEALAALERAASVLLPETDGVAGECRAALEAVARLDDVDAAAALTAPPSPASLANALETALVELRGAWHPEDEGGVRVLDATQARAVPCAHLFVIGAVHGAWPRELAEDPFLHDRVRAKLRLALGRPVPLRGSAGAEDRSLFGLLLAQARERVTISWALRDAQGRALSPSALLRNLPFVAPGTDLVPPDDAPIARPDARFARASLAGDLAHAALAAGRAQLRLTDDRASRDLRFDGAVGLAALPALAPLAPTFLELLGQCAQRAFFDSVLRARELEQPGPAGLDQAESGRLVHAALHKLYEALAAEGALRADTPERIARERAEALLPGALAAAAEEVRGDVQARHPRLFEAHLDSVAASIRDFLRRDLAELLPRGVAAIEPEQTLDARIELEGGAALEVEGRIDRILRRPDGGLRVGDYKTGRRFDQFLQPTEVRRGRSLQVPAYALVVAARRGTRDVVGEVLPVPRHPRRDRDDEREKQRSLDLAELERVALPALAELEKRLASGDFPLRPEEFACSHCPYTIACRYAQPDSVERSKEAPERASYYELARVRP